MIFCLFWMLFNACAPASAPDGNAARGNESKQVVEKVQDQPGHWFTDITESCGVQHINLPRQADPYFMPNSVGSGVAVIDVNHDGLMDLYCLAMASNAQQTGNQLFVQQSDGHFVDQTHAYGLDLHGYYHGAGVGDLNNDGFDDLVLSKYKGIQILRNRDGRRFEDITETCGVENPDWGMSVALTDYDRDHWLDIVLVNYIHYDSTHQCTNNKGELEFCGPQNFRGTPSRLFRNLGVAENGNHLQFEDVSHTSGLSSKPGPGLGVVCMDFTGDGHTDLFFADDMQPNRLFVNQADGTFKDEAGLRGIAVDGMGQAKADMGIAVADVDRNGLLDVFITHLKTENHTLWMQELRGFYTDKTLSSGLLSRQWKGTAFGTVMADFDSDGWPDLAMVNGGIRRNNFQNHKKRNEMDPFWESYAQRAQVFRNSGMGRFEENSDANSDFTHYGEVGRGLAAVDLDNDGAMDLVVSPIGSRVRVFKNIASRRGAWVGIHAVLPNRGGRVAFGAMVEVVVGDQVHRGVVNNAYSYLCANDSRLLLGLGNAEKLDEIRVIWPDQTMESFGPRAVNQYITLQKGSGQ